MADQILKVKIVATDDGFKAVVDSATTSLERIENAGRKFGSTLSSLSGLAAGLGVSLSAGYFAHLIKSTIDAGDELNKMAQKTATTVEGLSALQYAAQLSDLGNEQLAKGLEHLNKSMLDATVSTSTQARSFNALGIQTREANGHLRPTEQVLLDLADAFAKSSDKGATVALAMNIMGKSGAELIPLLNSGKAGITAMMEEARNLGIVIDSKTAAASERFNDNLTRLHFSARSFTVSLVNELAPDLVDISNAMVQAAKDSGLLTAVWVGLGGAANLIINGSQVSQINKQIADLQKQADFIRGGLQTGKRPVPFFEWLGLDIKFNDQALATGAANLRDIEFQLQKLITTRDNLLNPKKSQDSNGGGELAQAYACYNSGGVWDGKNKKCLNLTSGGQESAESYGKRMAKLARQAYPEATQSAEEFGEVQKQEALRWLANQESAEAYGKRMADLAKQGWPEATLSAEEYGEAQADIAKKMLANAEAADQSVQIYKDTATSIRGAFRDTFLDIENHGISSFKNMGTRILDIFKGMIADMATLAIARPIIMPIVTGLGGALGVSGQAQASVLQQLGINPLLAAGGGTSLLAGLGTFGTGISAGLSGGFGAVGALSGTTTAATTIGAGVGAAIPYVAAALAINALSHGGLFGTGNKVTGTGLDLNVAGGIIAAQNYTESTRKRSFFRGSESSIDYNAVDPALLKGLNDSLAAGQSALLQGAAGLGAHTAQSILDGFAASTHLALTGKSQDEVQKAIQDWLDKTLADMGKSILADTRFAGLARNASKDMIDALFALGQFFKANPLADAAEQMRIASRTILQQYQDQRAAVLALAKAYDGSAGATQALATATQSAYALEIQLAQQIAGVRGAIGSTIGGSIEDIRTSVMKPDQLYSYYSGQAQRLAGQLGSAADPATIATLVDQINSYTNKAYGTIPGAAQGGVAPQFVQFLQGVQTTADQRLATIEQSITASHQDVSKTIQDTMAAVAARMDAAARAQEAAAKAAKEAAQAQRDAAMQFYNYGHGRF